MKSLMKSETVNEWIDFHKKMKIPFTITLSTYTTRIQSKLCDHYFMKTEQPNRVFAGFNQLKNDVQKIKIKKIKVENLQYYAHGFHTDQFYSDVIYNVDINSAYVTILYNDGFISRKTFNYIRKLPKMERLATVGMLASKKNVFEIDEKGEIISEKVIVSETSDYFFYCVKRTSELMAFLQKHLGPAFLFSWVDGIYFLQEDQSSKKPGRIIQEYLQEIGYNSKFEKLTEFEVTGYPDYYNVKYIKQGKRKFMNVPKYDNTIVRKITNHLLTKDYN